MRAVWIVLTCFYVACAVMWAFSHNIGAVGGYVCAAILGVVLTVDAGPKR